MNSPKCIQLPGIEHSNVRKFQETDMCYHTVERKTHHCFLRLLKKDANAQRKDRQVCTCNEQATIEIQSSTVFTIVGCASLHS